MGRTGSWTRRQELGQDGRRGAGARERDVWWIVTVADGGRSAHDRFKRRRKREAQGLQSGGHRVVGLLRDKELHARDLLGVGLALHSQVARLDVVIVQTVMVAAAVAAIVVVEVVATQVRVDSARAVVPLMIVVRVRVHQRRAERAHRNGHGERDGQDSAIHSLILQATPQRVNTGLKCDGRWRARVLGGARGREPRAPVPTA